MNLETAKRELICFLTGENFDAEKMAEAVQLLAQHAPDELVMLRQALYATGIDALSECNDVSECLPDYLALGNKAPTRMPDVHLHLQSCDRCSGVLSVLKEIAEQRAEWVEFSRQLGDARRPTLLVLLQKGWAWVRAKRHTPVDREDVERGRQVGDWYLRPFRDWAVDGLRLDDSKPPLCLSTSLPNDVAKVNLLVKPEYQAREHKEVWHLHCELDISSRVSIISVGIGNANGLLTGTRALRVKRPAEFHLEPPTHEIYWLYFKWQFPVGQWQEHKTEIPLRNALKEES